MTAKSDYISKFLTTPLSDRLKVSKNIIDTYQRIPIIVDKSHKLNNCNIKKNKFLVPGDMTLGYFLHKIRNLIDIGPEQSLFLFINNTSPSVNELISVLYQKYKSEDDFLYIIYSIENTFG